MIRTCGDKFSTITHLIQGIQYERDSYTISGEKKKENVEKIWEKTFKQIIIGIWISQFSFFIHLFFWAISTTGLIL